MARVLPKCSLSSMLFLVALLIPVKLFSEVNADESLWGGALNGYLGVNLPTVAYPGYSTNPAFGFDARVLKYAEEGVKYYYSLGFDCLPLAVPDGIAETTQVIYGSNLNIGFNVNRFKRAVPVFSFGGGMYWDSIETEIPHFGSKSSINSFMGYNWGAGLEIKINTTFSVIPQARYHYIVQHGANAVIGVYSVNILAYFGEGKETVEIY